MELKEMIRATKLKPEAKKELIELIKKNIGKKADIIQGGRKSTFVTLHQCHVRGVEVDWLTECTICSDEKQADFKNMQRTDKKKGQVRS